MGVFLIFWIVIQYAFYYIEYFNSDKIKCINPLKKMEIAMVATTFYVYVIAYLNPIFSRGGGRGGMENLKLHFHFKNLNASNKGMCCLKF